MNRAALVEKNKTSVDVKNLRADFPMLSSYDEGGKLVYLDNGATTQKPWRVIEAMHKFDIGEYATVHRGAYPLAEHSSLRYEAVRPQVANFIGAKSGDEIVFTSGTTASINIAAHGFGETFIKEGDEIILTQMEHHANIVPWKVVADKKGALIKVVDVNDDGSLDMNHYRSLLSDRTKMVAVTQISNVLGTINDVKTMAELAHEIGAYILVDGAQSVAHMPVDMADIDCDFFAFSGHKMYGPNGIGVLYGRYELLEQMEPFITGGDMIEEVSFEHITYQKPPYRFEAGTPPVTQVVGLSEAISYISETGFDLIGEQEAELLAYATNLLEKIDGLRIIGKAPEKGAIVSFVLDCVHPHDLVSILGTNGIALRGGHHCAQPIMERFNVPATSRASFAFYNTSGEVRKLAKEIKNVVKLFS